MLRCSTGGSKARSRETKRQFTQNAPLAQSGKHLVKNSKVLSRENTGGLYLLTQANSFGLQGCDCSTSKTVAHLNTPGARARPTSGRFRDKANTKLLGKTG